jgi:hypothetical protein
MNGPTVSSASQNSRAVRVRFVVGKVALGQVIRRVLGLSSPSCHFTIASSSFSCTLHYGPSV